MATTFAPLAASGQSDPRLILAQQLLGSAGTPRTIGQGINAAGRDIIGAMLMRQALNDAEARRGDATSLVREMLPLLLGNTGSIAGSGADGGLSFKSAGSPGLADADRAAMANFLVSGGGADTAAGAGGFGVADPLANATGPAMRVGTGRTPQMDALMALLTNEDAMALPGVEALVSGTIDRAANPQAPRSRTRIEGNAEIFEQFDPATGQFVEVSRGPRFKGTEPRLVEVVDEATGNKVFVPENEAAGRIASTPGSQLTLAQSANAQETLAARRTLATLNMTPEEIVRRSQQFTATGRPNPDYRADIDRLARLATQRIPGSDPGFGSAWEMVFGVQPTAAATAVDPGGAVQPPPAGAGPGTVGLRTQQPRPPQPGASPGGLNLELNTIDLGGGSTPASPIAQPAAGAADPAAAGGPGGLGQPQNIPQTATGEVDFGRLNTTTIYGPVALDDGSNGFVRWDGAQFVPIRRGG